MVEDLFVVQGNEQQVGGPSIKQLVVVDLYVQRTCFFQQGEHLEKSDDGHRTPTQVASGEPVIHPHHVTVSRLEGEKCQQTTLLRVHIANWAALVCFLTPSRCDH